MKQQSKAFKEMLKQISTVELKKLLIDLKKIEVKAASINLILVNYTSEVLDKTKSFKVISELYTRLGLDKSVIQTELESRK